MRAIIEIIKKNNINCYLEIGSYIGGSALEVLKNTTIDKAVCIDYFDSQKFMDILNGDKNYTPSLKQYLETNDIYQVFLRNMRPFKNRVLAIKNNSHDGILKVADMKLSPGLIYIDGGHTYNIVKDDVEQCLIHFPNAIICGDDYSTAYPGVKRALDELTKKYPIKIINTGIFWRIIK